MPTRLERAHGAVSPLLHGVARHMDTVNAAVYRARRARLIASLLAQAELRGATVEVDVARDVRLERGVRVRIQPATTNRLHIGQGCRIGPDATILLKGGEVDLGPWADVRMGVILNVSGRFRLGTAALLSWGVVVHCADEVTIGEKCGLGDYVTVVDSTHFHTDAATPAYDNVVTRQVRIGANVWVGAKATISHRARIGDGCVVAAHSVVIGEVPDDHFAAGAPATVRPLDGRPAARGSEG